MTVTGFDAVGGSVHFLRDLFKGGAIEELAAEDPAIQRMENAFIDQFTQLRAREGIRGSGLNLPLSWREL